MSRTKLVEQDVAQLEHQLDALDMDATSVQVDALNRLLSGRAVLENVPCVVAVLDASCRILYLNRDLSAGRRADLIGTNGLDHVRAGDRERFTERFELALRTGEPQNVGFTDTRDDSWDTHLSPVMEEGSVVLVVASSANVTAQKQAEFALCESEARLRLALSATGMGTWTWDPRIDSITWDPTLCAMFGLEPDGYPRQHADYLKLVHPEDRERLAEALERHARTGVDEQGDHRIVRPDGEVRYVRGAGAALHDESGNLIGYRGGIIDVTVHRRLEEQLRQVQKMDALGQLTAGIAHNFNNVLGIIIPNVALCEEGASPEVQERLSDIKHAAERAAEMVRQLMVFARPDVSTQKSPLALATTIRRTVEMCRTTFDRRISITLWIEDPLPAVIGHAGQLEQVVLNVCLNARDALARKQRSQGRIAIHVESTGAHVCICISDNGLGMSESTRARIFEPFFTTKEAGRGTGLGLATAHSIVTDHGGTIRCESTLGEGTTFTIELPLAEKWLSRSSRPAGMDKSGPSEPPPEIQRTRDTIPSRVDG